MTVYNADAGEARRDDWVTPDWLFRWCSVVWGPFDMDVAASELNHKVALYLTAVEDGLLSQWGPCNWCNPPFNLAAEFTERAAVMATRGGSSLLLLPVATGSRWFHDNVFHEASELVFLRGRVAFEADGQPVPGNNSDSVLAWYSRRSCVSHDTPSLHTVSTKQIRDGVLPYRRMPRQIGIMDQ